MNLNLWVSRRIHHWHHFPCFSLGWYRGNSSHIGWCFRIANHSHCCSSELLCCCWWRGKKGDSVCIFLNTRMYGWRRSEGPEDAETVSSLYICSIILFKPLKTSDHDSFAKYLMLCILIIITVEIHRFLWFRTNYQELTVSH